MERVLLRHSPVGVLRMRKHQIIFCRILNPRLELSQAFDFLLGQVNRFIAPVTLGLVLFTPIDRGEKPHAPSVIADSAPFQT